MNELSNAHKSSLLSSLRETSEHRSSCSTTISFIRRSQSMRGVDRQHSLPPSDSKVTDFTVIANLQHGWIQGSGGSYLIQSKKYSKTRLV